MVSKNVERTSSDASRSMIGIKADGSVVFYTIDGRQASSYGVKLSTLSKRLSELGCVEAINFDGGGSTSINGMLPGDWHSTLLNSPSDGALRPCTNFFMLLNKSVQTSQLSKLYIYPYNGYYLTGEKEKFTVKGVDSGYYPVELTDKPVFSVDKEGCSIDSEGNAVFSGNGEWTITVTSGGLTSSVRVFVTDSPDNLVFQNEDGWKNISAVKLSRGEAIELSAVPYYRHTEHFAEDTLLKWEGSEGVGYVDGDGTFVAPNKPGSGKIRVSMGTCFAELPFTVTDSTAIKNEGNYSDAVFSLNSGKIVCELKNKYNIPVSWATVYIDGKKVDSDITGNTVTADISDNFMHKVKILSDNILGTKTLAYYTVNGDFEQIFPDAVSHWAEKYISHLTELGITDYSYTVDNSSFKPDLQMTRLDFAMMLCKSLEYNPENYTSVNPDYVDIDLIPDSCIPYVNILFEEKLVSDTVKEVYLALLERGYNPINQIVGYILSGDPTYITSYNDARNLIRKLLKHG